MYALQTVGSTTSSVKDDTEVLEIDDNGNSIVDQIINTSNNIKRTGNLTSNGGYLPSQNHPVINNSYERENVDEDHRSVGLCFWAPFQAVGLVSVAAIICQCIIFDDGYIEPSSATITISRGQLSNWHYTLTAVGFIYLYANSIFLVKHDKSTVTLPYIMLHTFAYLVSALGMIVMYSRKDKDRPADSMFLMGHLYSLHSWTGVFAAALFTFQWLTTVLTFMMPCLHNLGLPLGRVFSLYTVLASTICLISGVNAHAEKYMRVEHDYYSPKSLAMNVFGMLVMIFLFLIAYMVIKPNKK